MENILETGEQLVVILGFFGAVFSFAILRPLNNSIVKLELMIDELREDIRRNEERRHEMEIKLAEIDQRARSAHHRLDDFQDNIEKMLEIKLPRRRREEENK